jgi:2-polyprenyl-3-methyl-5-hydroxy-6-metoxy-1,4-benzoquinol methylase
MESGYELVPEVNGKAEVASPATESLRDVLYSAYVSAFKGDSAMVAKPFARGERAALRRFVAPILDTTPRDAAILDLGCGDGMLLAYLAEQGFTNCRGVDHSHEQAALARSRGAVVEVGSLFGALEAATEAWDVVFFIDVIEHLTKNELVQFGRLVFRALKPGGRLVIHTPNGEGLSHGHIVYGDLTHETIFNENSMIQFLRAFGFHRVSVRETGPIPHSVFGAIRFAGWQVIRLGAQLSSVIQNGRCPKVLTATLLACAEKPAR